MVHSLLLSAVLLVAPAQPGAAPARATRAFAIETGRPFNAALPRDFYLEGNAIPTEKRNATLVATPSGKQLLFALLDTSGYSSQVQQKYMGMMIAEASVRLGAARVPVGSYGFGLKTLSGETYLAIYNQAGVRIASCRMKKDLELKAPRPLQVILASGGGARLYIGREWVQIK